nr:MAG TPA: hypothetical protein [Bacteriophage sp.]
MLLLQLYNKYCIINIENKRKEVMLYDCYYFLFYRR